MPEGHTIHRAAHDQTLLFAGTTLTVDSPQGRFDDGAALLDGRTLRAIHARGKHLLYDFGAGVWLHVHLGLYGRFRTGTGAAPPPEGAIRVRFRGGGRWPAAVAAARVMMSAGNSARRASSVTMSPDRTRRCRRGRLTSLRARS